MLAREDQTIIAQCTPHGNGALALLRLSGKDAIDVAQAMARLPKEACLEHKESHTIHYGHVIDRDGAVVDQVMFLLMRAPKTFTGHDTVEITCHNNLFLIDHIIHEACAQGARPAEAGEFTRRAVSHGKIDLVQAEAIHDIVAAQSQASLKKSLSNLKGTFSRWLSGVEDILTKALAWSEASFDFLEDDGGFGASILGFIQDVRRHIAYAQKAFDSQKHIREGVRIAIVGSVNAGKSSLFNALTQHERAIVTDIAGTTRDSIEAGMYRDGLYWTLVDTAGLRQTADKIEQEGIKRSHEEAHKADVVILVVDGSRQLGTHERDIYQHLIEQHQRSCILVYNKADLVSSPQDTHHLCSSTVAYHVISTQTCHGVAELEQTIHQRIHQRVQHADTPFLINKRQAHVLQTLDGKMADIEAMLQHTDVQYELVSYHLKDALEHMSELTGKSVSEAGMDRVFQEFCVGK